MAQTRRFLGGRHPLWGIGVTSRIETTRRPTDASAWMADSRPLPGPWTRTCTRRRPRFIASRPQFSAATVAANGVDFLEPLNPALPADPHASALPRMSVMVISRLLNVAEMCAMPSDSTTFLERLALGALAGAGAVILLLRHFLLARDGAARPLLGARVGVSPLAPHREPPAVADAAVAADIHQPLDVHRDFGAEGALHLDRPLDDLPEPGDFGVGEIPHPGVGAHARLAQKPAAGGPADAVDGGEADLGPRLAWEVHACDACHDQPCRCLCLGLRLQMMRVTPCRLTTLQCSQIGLTLERTFTRFSGPVKD